MPVFETTRSRFIQILHHFSVSWMITQLYFFSSNFRSEVFRLFSGWVKIHQIPYDMFENISQFFFKLCIPLHYCFNWNCTWFGQKEPIKVQNFRLSVAHVKFHQICTLIGSFCWKYIKFQLKEYRGVISHDPEKGCKTWRKTDSLFQKWQEVGEFWPEHSKVSKLCILIGPSTRKSQKFAFWLVPFV